jgi:hypothetical protein
MDGLGLPFDQYQRYKMIQEVTEAIRGEEPLHVLDVGGSPGTLRRFLPSDQVMIADLDVSNSDICANGVALPFESGSFDIVITSDTLEHVPPDMRQNFLGELMRVSKTWLVVGAPFDDPEVVRAEEVMEALMLARYDEVHHCLQEHRRYGLPSLEETLSLLHDSGYETVVLPNGYLYTWLVGLSTFWLLQWRFQDASLSARVNSFYNANFYQDDNREPSYRKVIVAGPHAGRRLTSLADRASSEKVRSESGRLIALQTLNLLVQVLIEGWSEQAVEMEGRVHDLAQQLVQKDEIIEEQAKFVEEQQSAIEDQRRAIEDQARVIEEQKRAIHEQARVIEEQVKIMEEQARANEDLQRRFEDRYRLLVYAWRKLRSLFDGDQGRGSE